MNKYLTIVEEKNKGGRPRIELTDAQLEELKILSVTCTLDEIADYFGITRETFRQMRIRDEEVSSHYKKGLINAKKMVGNKIFKRAVLSDDLTAQIYWMNHRGRWLKELNNKDEEVKDNKLEITTKIFIETRNLFFIKARNLLLVTKIFN
jgi:hypothetical protein